MVTLRTPRLVLRRWREEDLAPLAAINADPEVMRWIGDGTVVDRPRTERDVAAYERLWRTAGFGRFAVEHRHTGALVGFTGLAVPTDVPEIMPAVEIGWRLARDHWGRGLATEAARAVLRFAFTECGLDRVVGIHVIGNDASARVMAKLGMRPERDTIEVVYGRAVRVHAAARLDARP